MRSLRQCERCVTGAENDGGATTTASYSDSTLMIHQALTVTWDAYNRLTFSSKPPVLNSGQTIPGREAPQPVPSEALFAREINDTPFQQPYLNIMMIGLPVIFGALFICLFCMCYWNRRKMRKRGQEVPLDSLPLQARDENPSANVN